MTDTGHVIRLALRSTYDLLDIIELVSDRLSELAGLDEDSAHWVSVAVRESVINAIKHGNKEDAAKEVVVLFEFAPRQTPTRFSIEVLDQGAGFDPEEIADPLAPENVLKSSGRGIFFMKSFMDDVRIARRPEGGMSVRLVKNLA
jgi:serine/threonine-protein kinase RsbW